jgi:N-acetylmuramoyl-L-alanine amidase
MLIQLLAAGLCAEEAPGPDWNTLSKYQGSITRKELCRLIDNIYNPSKAIYRYLNVTDEYVEIFEDAEKTTLDFTLELTSPGKSPRFVKQTYKTIAQLRELHNPPNLPLKGVRIVLDPGHIGGKWASMEERSVKWGDHPVIREGDKNIQVARIIRSRLQALGAAVYLTHEKPEPVTSFRTRDFMEEAQAYVYAKEKVDEEKATKQKVRLNRLIQWYAELFFYRRAEIAQRAENIRRDFPPDLNISNHFNATERSGSGEIVSDNRIVFLINGCYGPDEVENSVSRYFLFSKLLEHSLDIELAVGDALTEKFLRIAKLPPVKYGREKYQCRVNDNPYLYARNLAANRQYPGPCIILEPFYMNNNWTAARLAAGDYEGVRTVAGGQYRSLIQEYADAVTDAIVEVYSKWTVDPDKKPSVKAQPVASAALH